jgi:cation diffusion facilitator family transporter
MTMSSRESEDIRSLQLTVAVYAIVLAMKVVVYLMSGVMALLAEALHTLSDLFVSGFLLAAMYFARKAPDRVHTFGHGRAQNVAALVAATLFISFTSFELYREAIPRLFKAHEAAYQNLPWVIGVLVVSMLIAAAPIVKLIRQKTRGAAAKAQLTELFNDEAGLGAALLGTLFIAWGKPIADPLAAIVVASIIAYNAIGLFRENASFLMGRSPEPEFLAEIERLTRGVPGVLDIHDLRAEYSGPDTINAGLHIEVRRGLAVEEADRIAEEVTRQVQQVTAGGYCVVHVDPQAPDFPRDSSP